MITERNALDAAARLCKILESTVASQMGSISRPALTELQVCLREVGYDPHELGRPEWAEESA